MESEVYKHLSLIALLTIPSTTLAQDYSLSDSGWTNGPAGTTTYTGTQNIQAGPNAWAISPYTGSTMVGLTPTNPTATYSNMTSALGMSSDSVSALSAEIAAQNPQGGGNITNAAWIYKDFPLAATTKFSMYWVYTSTDYVPFNDGSITTFVNTGGANQGKINNVLTQYILLGATNPGTGNYSTGSYGSTGWQIVNYEAVDAGTYRLGFASFNQGDTALSPVLYVNDGLGTVTKNGQIFGAVAPNNPDMPTVGPVTPSNPTVVSTTTTNPIVASTTTFGSPMNAASLVTLGSTNTGAQFNVTQTTTPVTATSYEITTITTPQVIQTWSDNTTTTIADPNNPGTTTTQTGTTYELGASSATTKVASSTGAKDAITYRNMNLFLIEPLNTRDGVWSAPIGSYGTNYALGGVAIGWQKTVDNNSVGFALSHSQGDSYDYTRSKTTTDSTAGTAYILSRQPYLWLKGSVGLGSSNYDTTISIPEFALINKSKVRQYNYYADIGIYSAETYKGFRPLVGTIINHSNIDGTETGSYLLSALPKNQNITKASPYIGTRYEFSKKASIETRIITNTDVKTVISNRLSTNEEITKNIHINATLGFDKGVEKKYNNFYGLVGVKWVF
jgi:hypothetical protein